MKLNLIDLTYEARTIGTFFQQVSIMISSGREGNTSSSAAALMELACEMLRKTFWTIYSMLCRGTLITVFLLYV